MFFEFRELRDADDGAAFGWVYGDLVGIDECDYHLNCIIKQVFSLMMQSMDFVVAKLIRES